MELRYAVSDTHVLVKDNYNSKRLNRNIVFEEVIHNKQYENELMRRRKMTYALRRRDQEAAEQHARETRNGYCPHCFMQIPMSGVCDCGYTVKK